MLEVRDKNLIPSRCLDCAFLRPPYTYDSWVCAAKKFCNYVDIRIPDSAIRDKNCPLCSEESFMNLEFDEDEINLLLNLLKDPSNKVCNYCPLFGHAVDCEPCIADSILKKIKL